MPPPSKQRPIISSRNFPTSLSLTAEDAKALSNSDDIAYIQQDGEIYGTELLDQWGLDRVDQQSLPLDNSYTPYSIFDSGIRTTHEQFEGTRVFWGKTFTEDNRDYDCHGRGTHVAGTVAGRDYGVANQATVVAIKVLDCSNKGKFTYVIDAIEWLMNSRNVTMPAVANLSLGGGKNAAADDAVSNLHNSGVPTIVSAGNLNSDACDRSPAGAVDVITVGATEITDVRSSFSNYGPCGVRMV